MSDRLHRSGIRLIGQMELFVVSDRPDDRKEGVGWFGYHDRLWDEKLLGPRPARRALDLLEEPDLGHALPGLTPEARQATDTVALCGCRVNLKALNCCVNKPGWRQTQKAMVKAASDHGIDGFITNRNFIGHCACSDCTRKFRRFLAERFTPEQLRQRLGIANLDQQPLCVFGCTASTTALRRPWNWRNSGLPGWPSRSLSMRFTWIMAAS